MVSKEELAAMGYMYLCMQGLISWGSMKKESRSKPDCKGRVYVNGRRCQ